MPPFSKLCAQLPASVVRHSIDGRYGSHLVGSEVDLRRRPGELGEILDKFSVNSRGGVLCLLPRWILVFDSGTSFLGRKIVCNIDSNFAKEQKNYGLQMLPSTQNLYARFALNFAKEPNSQIDVIFTN